MDYPAAKQLADTQDTAVPVILVVEDHPATLKLVQELLSVSFPTCHLVGVSSAERALEICSKIPPHIVIMDIALPGMNGIDATRCVKSLSPATHVVVHSSYDLEIYRQAAADANASGFVAKASTCTDLVPTIASLLADLFDEPQSNGASQAVCRDFRTYSASGTGLI